VPVFSRKCCPPLAGNPIQRAANTRNRCPCANSAVSPATARAGYHPVHSRTNLFRRLATRAPIPEDQPARRHLVDLLGRQSLVLAVAPFDQVGVSDGSIAEACQLTSLSRPPHRAAENKAKWVGGENRPHPRRKPATVVSQRNVRLTGVPAIEAPRGLSMSNREHVHIALRQQV
jgi:hypothetical protein